jgi:hypothetical protein
MSDTLPTWDAFQRDVLDALGHVVYAPRDAAPATSAAPPTMQHTPDRADAAAPPLLRALSRAANVAVAALPDLPAIALLRTPAAKRALWPRLRAMRKGARP